MVTMLRRLWTDEEGQGMAEYGLMLSLVAVVVIAALMLLGSNLRDTIQGVAEKITPPA